MSVANATISGWPGLIPFDASAPMNGGVAPGNWYMVQVSTQRSSRTKSVATPLQLPILMWSDAFAELFLQDGNPIKTRTAAKWLLPFYGLLETRNAAFGRTAAPTPSPVIAVAINTDDTMEHWKFYSLVNDGHSCDARDPRARPAPWTTGRCDPTEGALTRLTDGRLLYVWRNDPGYNCCVQSADFNSNPTQMLSSATVCVWQVQYLPDGSSL